MKVEGFIFGLLAVFFFIVSIVYWYLSNEPAGTTALALTFGLAALIGFYLVFVGRRIPPRPEDRPDADISEGSGVVGFFSPHSWWPLGVGFGAAVVALGTAFAEVWVMIVGAFLLILATTGFVFEYYRGETHFH